MVGTTTEITAQIIDKEALQDTLLMADISLVKAY